MPFLLFISGASGAGKTAVVEHLQVSSSQRHLALLNFDSMGIPTNEEMIAQAGSLERWAEKATHAWMEKIAREYKDHPVVILEGQANPDFVRAGCAKNRLTDFALVLLDCDWECRSQRLIQRRQSELANPHMKNWSDFLRNQARQQGIKIIDTTTRTVKQVADEILALAPPDKRSGEIV